MIVCRIFLSRVLGPLMVVALLLNVRSDAATPHSCNKITRWNVLRPPTSPEDPVHPQWQVKGLSDIPACDTVIVPVGNDLPEHGLSGVHVRAWRDNPRSRPIGQPVCQVKVPEGPTGEECINWAYYEHEVNMWRYWPRQSGEVCVSMPDGTTRCAMAQGMGWSTLFCYEPGPDRHPGGGERWIPYEGTVTYGSDTSSLPCSQTGSPADPEGLY